VVCDVLVLKGACWLLGATQKCDAGSEGCVER
jgi:hypothetical protein